MEYGRLPKDIGSAIVQACDELIAGKLDEHFPLVRAWLRRRWRQHTAGWHAGTPLHCRR